VISPPAVTILPLEPTPRSPAPLPQEQEQKKMIIKLGTDFITNLLSPSVNTTTSNDNNYNSKKRGEANLSTENTKEEEQLEENSH
jgi:hypothetical protein